MVWIPVVASVLFTFGSYVLLSTIFYYRPELIHKKKLQKKYNFLVISHRGGSGESNENTLAAFEHSRDIGVDVVELDCQLTNDGLVVVSHDNNLKRLTGVDKMISELNYEELPRLLEEREKDIFLKDDDSNDQSLLKFEPKLNSNHDSLFKIPLLEEVFKQLPKTQINLDVKIKNDVLINRINDLIVKYKREDITVWGSFNEATTSKCHRLNPNISVYFSSQGCFKIFIFCILGLLPFLPFKESYLEIVMPTDRIKKKLPLLIRIPIFIGESILIRKSMVSHFKKRGIMVYYWVLNTDEEFRKAIDMGVNGIITDYPTRLISFIENNPEYKKKLIRPE